MTLICGCRDSRNDIWIAGDSRGINGSFAVPAVMPKLLRAGDWRMGWAGNEAASLYLRHAAGRLAECAGIDDLALVTRQILQEAGFRDAAPVGAAGPPDHGQECLVAHPTGLWVIEPDGSVWQPDRPFVAIARAQDIAYGAAAILMGGVAPDDGPQLLRRVLKIGAQFYTSVGPPYWVERVS